MTNELPNGAGFMPYEDVPPNVEYDPATDLDICPRCDGELYWALFQDNLTRKCTDCNYYVY